MSEQTIPKLVWEADSTHPQLAEKVREALRQVVDPEIGLNIIELGLIRQMSVGGSQVDIKIILTTPFCPYGPALLEMARKQAADAAGMPVNLELSMDMWDPSMMEDGAGAAWGF